jgi:small subunit ribosomal protein S16
VVTESTNSTKSGKFLEILGSYDPRTDKPVFNAEKIKEWISKGARVTDSVHNLLINQKIISGKKINVLPKKTVPKKEEPEVRAEKATEVKTEVVEEASAEMPAEV